MGLVDNSNNKKRNLFFRSDNVGRLKRNEAHKHIRYSSNRYNVSRRGRNSAGYLGAGDDHRGAAFHRAADTAPVQLQREREGGGANQSKSLIFPRFSQVPTSDSPSAQFERSTEIPRHRIPPGAADSPYAHPIPGHPFLTCTPDSRVAPIPCTPFILPGARFPATFFRGSRGRSPYGRGQGSRGYEKSDIFSVSIQKMLR
jgi:hypothetical protein